MPIKLHDKTFDTYLSEEDIQRKIKEIAAAINNVQFFYKYVIAGLF